MNKEIVEAMLFLFKVVFKLCANKELTELEWKKLEYPEWYFGLEVDEDDLK